MAQWFRHMLEIGRMIPHSAFYEKNQPCVALGKLKLHSPRQPPEGGKDNPLLSILYLENFGKGQHRSELT